MSSLRRWDIAHFLLGRCNPDSANGIDKTVFHLAREQGAAGHSVRVVALTSKPAIPIPGVSVQNHPPVVGRVPGLPAVAQDLFVDRARWNLSADVVDGLLSNPPDVVHFHHTRVPQAVRIGNVLRRHGIPYCVTLHGALVDRARERRAGMKTAYMRLIESRFLDGAAFLHGVSELDAMGARRVGLSAPIVVVPNGIDVRPSGAGDRLKLTGLFAPPQGQRIAVFLGRLDPEQKGLDVLLQSLARVEGLSLALIGPTFRDGRHALEELASRLGLENRIAFLGPKHGEEKFDLLAGADFFVYPSRWEGLPLAPLEAASVALPGVLSPAADPTGWIVGSGGALESEVEVEALAGFLSKMTGMSDSDLHTMGERARSCVLKRFNWKAIAEQIVGAYAEHCLPR